MDDTVTLVDELAGIGVDERVAQRDREVARSKDGVSWIVESDLEKVKMDE